MVCGQLLLRFRSLSPTVSGATTSKDLSAYMIFTPMFAI
ncbi:hypothetical protein SP41_132 [Salmonella phage 41]|nr:hypothetical protein SP41_132 [Salmonella phage 41]